jgi:hypothetical protein
MHSFFTSNLSTHTQRNAVYQSTGQCNLADVLKYSQGQKFSEVFMGRPLHQNVKLIRHFRE